MTLQQSWHILRKQWRFILACFLIVGLGTFVVSKLMTPLYQSVALVEVTLHSSGSQVDYTGLLASDQLVSTEAQLATSDPVLRAVASHYGGMTETELAKMVVATSQLNTQLFSITVVDASPQRAATLANDIAATLIKQQYQAAQQSNGPAQQQIQQNIQSTQKQAASINSKIANLQATGGNQSQISDLQGQLSQLQQYLSQLQTALAQLQLSEAQNNNFLQIMQSAQPAQTPVRPNVLLYTLGGFAAGAFLGILLALLLDQLDTRIRSAESLKELLGWTVMGTIWQKRGSGDSEFAVPQGHDANVEAYRILRTNIGFAGVDKPLRTLLVTSASPGDGKSTVAANLAVFMAKAGKSTLLIDADLRRPTQHRKFNLAAEKMGLSNAIMNCNLAGIADSSSSLHGQFMHPSATTLPPLANNSVMLASFIHPTNVPNLHLMPSGPLPPNPSEILDSKAMQRFMAMITNCGADVVIFDTPPVYGLSDTNILASKVDGVLVVVDARRATRGMLLQIKTLFGQAGANVIGCVLNKQRPSKSDSSYSSYYYYRGTNEQESAKKLPNSEQDVAEAVHVPHSGSQVMR